MAKVTLKKSAVIALAELMHSVEYGEDVLLLRISDSNANEAVQAYNDALNDNDEVEEEYRAFIDRLAERFAKAAHDAIATEAGAYRPQDIKAWGEHLLQGFTATLGQQQ